MSTPLFSVVSTAKNEKDRKLLEKTFENWELARQLFEKKSGKCIEFIIADAGGNAEFPQIEDSTIITPKSYEKYRIELYEDGIIKYPWWDCTSIGRNLGFKYAKGKMVVFLDIDTMVSTGTEADHKYDVEGLDNYENYFGVMYKAFKRKDIIGAAPSSRSRDRRTWGRVIGHAGLNCLTRLSLKLPTIELNGITIAGPIISGYSITVLRDAVLSICDKSGPYDPEFTITEDDKFSRLLGRHGKLSYEGRAGVFTRTLKRVGSRFELARGILYGIKCLPPYLSPKSWKYQKHDRSI